MKAGGLRRTAALLMHTKPPDVQGPYLRFGGKEYVPAERGGLRWHKTRESGPQPHPALFKTEFELHFARERVRHHHEHRHQFWFLTRKTPEFWKDYVFHYKLGCPIQEWREARVRAVVEELFWNDAVQTTAAMAYEAKRVAEKLVTLAKDGGRTSRRIMQEFFEYVPWGGGFKIKKFDGEWTEADRPGDMRVMYKILDDFPQRYRNRHGNYCLLTQTSTSRQRCENQFINHQKWKPVNLRRGRVTILEMTDRDMSIFHRGQMCTGDKGADVWDKETDRPLLEAGYTKPEALEWEDQYVQLNRKVHDMNMKKFFSDDMSSKDARRAGEFMASPMAETVGFQPVPGTARPDVGDSTHFGVLHRERPGIVGKATEQRYNEWPTDLANLEEYIREMRSTGTQRQLFKDENFYKLFPTTESDVWLEKMYRPYMKLSPEQRSRAFQILDNLNYHNLTTPAIVDALPMPSGVEWEAKQDHFRETWAKKMEYLDKHPHVDPRDKHFINQGELDGVEDYLRKKKQSRRNRA